MVAVFSAFLLGYKGAQLSLAVQPTVFGLAWRLTATFVAIRAGTEVIFRAIEYNRPTAQVTGYFLVDLVGRYALLCSVGALLGFGAFNVAKAFAPRFPSGRWPRRVARIVFEAAVAALTTWAVNQLVDTPPSQTPPPAGSAYEAPGPGEADAR